MENSPSLRRFRRSRYLGLTGRSIRTPRGSTARILLRFPTASIIGHDARSRRPPRYIKKGGYVVRDVMSDEVDEFFAAAVDDLSEWPKKKRNSKSRSRSLPESGAACKDEENPLVLLCDEGRDIKPIPSLLDTRAAEFRGDDFSAAEERLLDAHEAALRDFIKARKRLEKSARKLEDFLASSRRRRR
ncbi:hypothetical protein OF83DRAFT_1088778 [Amylostereum chailletii]|nr:hypothetical protein OF83DRAFT_1088778 [Amylostereum chailletii]